MIAALHGAAQFWRVAAALSRAGDAAIGATPRQALARRDGITLWRYDGAEADRFAPLLIVHGLIGRPSICDLAPGRSLVGALVAQGVAVHLLDWGPNRPGLRWLAFEDLALDALAWAVRGVTRAQGRRPVVMGVCEGGLFALCLAALEPDSVAGVVAAVTPVDNHADPDAALPRLVRAFTPDQIEALLDVMGGLPGGAMGAVFAGLTPSRTLEKHTAGLLATDGDPERIADFLRMERWLADRPDHPLPAARQLLLEIYHANALVRGALRLDDRPVDLRAITAPVLSLLGLRDHLVPPSCAGALARVPGVDHRLCAIDAGHVGVFVSARARGEAAAALADFLTDPAVLG